MSSVLWTPLTGVSHILNLAGRFSEAEPYAREEIAVLENALVPEADARLGQSLYQLSTALYGQHKYSEAARILARSQHSYELSGPSWARRAEELRKLMDERAAGAAGR